MGNNIIEHQYGTIIVNGGNALKDCPKCLEEAKIIETKLNTGKYENDPQPQWKFDCGFKLDYDGELVRVSSRFYPPKTHYGPTWDGSVSIYFLQNKICSKKFDCETLEELHTQVEEYMIWVKERILTLLNTGLNQ